MRNVIVKILKKAVKILEKKELPLIVTDQKILKNIFKADYKKRVLISYLKQPFIEGIKYHHTNYLECYTAAEVFNDLGYAVDIVDLFEDDIEINFSNYEIVYGLGVSLEKSFYSKNTEKILKILYSTGYNPFYSFLASATQVKSFYLSHGLLIPESSRVLKSFWTFQYILSDYVIALGNKLVSDSFKNLNNKIVCNNVNAFYFDVYDIDLENKNFYTARKHFLWFGSSGLLHKGLDLVIDIFSERPDITLHICGANKGETKFWNFYQPIVDKCENIIDYGFVDIQNEQFKFLMNKCAFCIFPTASEGGAPSLLNVMANGGLIPLAARTCGVDIDDIGIVFDELDKEIIKLNIDKAVKLNSQTLKTMSQTVKDSTRNNYSLDFYKKNIKENIINALNLKTN